MEYPYRNVDHQHQIVNILNILIIVNKMLNVLALRTIDH